MRCAERAFTAAKPGVARARPHSSCRQRYSWLAWIPASRATADATAPGSIAAATIRSFSAHDQRRRRSTDVITSTCVFVIGLPLGLVLWLHRAYLRSRKTVLTERIHALAILKKTDAMLVANFEI